MPKNYSEIYTSVYTTGNSMSFGNTMLRGNGIPLDITEVYDSFDKAVIYAATNAVAYEGQILAVTENGDTTAYIITPANQGKHSVGEGEEAVEYDVFLKPIGVIPTGDGKTIAVTEAGQISLKVANDSDRDAGSQLTLQADGTIKWVKPDTSTAEGQNQAIKALQDAVGTAKTDTADATGLYLVDENLAAEDARLAGLISGLDARLTAEEGKADNNTEYTFTNGTDGKFSVKANNSETSVEVDTGAKKYADDAIAAAKSTIDSDIAKKLAIETYNVDKAALESAIGEKAAQSDLNTLSGTVASNKTDIEGKLSTETTAREQADTALSGRITTLETTITGLEGAMHFAGTSTTDPLSEGGATVEGVESFNSGDVVLFDGKEYIYNGAAWVLFGDEGSYLTKTAAAETYATKAALSEETTARTNAISALQTAVDGKAAQTELEALQKTVADNETDIEGKVSALTTTVTNNKAAADETEAKATQNAKDIKAHAEDADVHYTDAKVKAITDPIATGLAGEIEAREATDAKVTALETRAGTIEAKDTEQDDKISALETTVGNAESGLVKDLADLAALVEDIDYIDETELDEELAAFKTTYVDVVDKKVDDHIADTAVHHTKTQIDGYIDTKLASYSDTTAVNQLITDAVDTHKNEVNSALSGKADTSTVTELSNRVSAVETKAGSTVQEVRADAATGLVVETTENIATIKFLEDVVFVMDGGTAADIINAQSAE